MTGKTHESIKLPTSEVDLELQRTISEVTRCATEEDRLAAICALYMQALQEKHQLAQRLRDEEAQRARVAETKQRLEDACQKLREQVRQLRQEMGKEDGAQDNDGDHLARRTPLLGIMKKHRVELGSFADGGGKVAVPVRAGSGGEDKTKNGDEDSTKIAGVAKENSVRRKSLEKKRVSLRVDDGSVETVSKCGRGFKVAASEIQARSREPVPKRQIKATGLDPRPQSTKSKYGGSDFKSTSSEIQQKSKRLFKSREPQPTRQITKSNGVSDLKADLSEIQPKSRELYTKRKITKSNGDSHLKAASSVNQSSTEEPDPKRQITKSNGDSDFKTASSENQPSTEKPNPNLQITIVNGDRDILPASSPESLAKTKEPEAKPETVGSMESSFPTRRMFSVTKAVEVSIAPDESAVGGRKSGDARLSLVSVTRSDIPPKPPRSATDRKLIGESWATMDLTRR